MSCTNVQWPLCTIQKLSEASFSFFDFWIPWNPFLAFPPKCRICFFLKSLFQARAQINSGNRTEWSPIQSVIVQVIYKSDDHIAEVWFCLIMSMITDRIGQHKVLLTINHNYNKICDILGFFELNGLCRSSPVHFV